MARFVLIHGASHGGWCWDKVVPQLQRAGHEVLAPDLPGMGSDKTPLAEITLAGWGEFVAKLVRASPQPSILVGHSRGGTVIGEAAERVPERVIGLIYLTAVLLPPGSILFETRDVMDSDAAKKATFDEIAITMDPAAARETFYGTCDPEDADWALSKLSPEPVKPNRTPLGTTDARWGKLPRAYIECLDDKTLTIDFQRKMQIAYPCDPVVSLTGDHSPFLSKPHEVTQHLDAIATVFASRRQSPKFPFSASVISQ